MKTTTRWWQLLGVFGAAVVLHGCGGLVGREGWVYEPTANWGDSNQYGGCPGSAPSIRLVPRDPDFVRIQVGIWDSLQTDLRQIPGPAPTLFIALYKVEPFWRWSSKTPSVDTFPVTVHVSQPFIEMVAENGVVERIPIPELPSGMQLMGKGTIINIPLLGIRPQNVVVTIPDFFVNGNLIQAGKVSFKYEKQTRYLQC